MGTELLSRGREDHDEPAVGWELRADRTTRVLAALVAVTALVGVGAVRAADDAPAPDPVRMRPAARQARLGAFVRRTADPAVREATATIAPDGSFVVSPIQRPSAPAARRAAELVMSKQCSNIERPRYRLIRGSVRGLSATFVVARSSETPHRNAGFQLRLTWDEGRYVGVVTEAYGGCLGG